MSISWTWDEWKGGPGNPYCPRFGVPHLAGCMATGLPLLQIMPPVQYVGPETPTLSVTAACVFPASCFLFFLIFIFFFIISSFSLLFRSRLLLNRKSQRSVPAVAELCQEFAGISSLFCRGRRMNSIRPNLLKLALDSTAS